MLSVRRLAPIGARLTGNPRIGLVATQAVMVVAGLVPSLLVARELGPSAMGVYSGTLRISALMLSLVSLSYAHGLAQWAATMPRSAVQAAWRGALLLWAPQGLLAAFLVYEISRRLARAEGETHHLFFALLAVATGVQILILSGQHLLRGRQQYVEFNLNRLAQSLLWTLGALVLFALHRFSLSLLGGIWLLAQIITLALVLRQVIRQGVRPQKGSSSGCFWFGLRAHLAVVGRDAASYVDQLIILAVLGAAALGVYAPASAYSGLVLIVGASMSLVVQPRVAQAPATQRRSVALRHLTEATAMAAVVASLCALSAQSVIPVVYGSNFELSGRLAVVMSIAVVFDVMTLVSVASLQGMGLPGKSSMVQGVSTGLVAIMLIGVVMRWDITKVPIALLIAYSLSALTGLLIMLTSDANKVLGKLDLGDVSAP